MKKILTFEQFINESADSEKIILQSVDLSDLKQDIKKYDGYKVGPIIKNGKIYKVELIKEQALDESYFGWVYDEKYWNDLSNYEKLEILKILKIKVQSVNKISYKHFNLDFFKKLHDYLVSIKYNFNMKA
jgi:hypothetical protein